MTTGSARSTASSKAHSMEAPSGMLQRIPTSGSAATAMNMKKLQKSQSRGAGRTGAAIMVSGVSSHSASSKAPTTSSGSASPRLRRPSTATADMNANPRIRSQPARPRCAAGRLKVWGLQGVEVSRFMRRNVFTAPLLSCVGVGQYRVALPRVAVRATHAWSRPSAVPEHGLPFRKKGMHAFVRILAGKACMELPTLETDAFGERSLPCAVHRLLDRHQRYQVLASEVLRHVLVTRIA